MLTSVQGFQTEPSADVLFPDFMAANQVEEKIA
jgi:hypothetical protein